MKLSIEEREALEELFLNSQGWQVLLSLIETECAGFSNQLATYNLESGTERFLRMKSELDGAKKLQQRITALREKHIRNQR